MRVKAEDGGRPPLSTLTTVTIHIVDANDHAPLFTLTNYSTEVPEDIPPGTSILKVLDSLLFFFVTYTIKRQIEFIIILCVSILSAGIFKRLTLFPSPPCGR